jgi:hypothetical protein
MSYLDTKDIDRDSGFVCAQTNLIKLLVVPSAIFYGVRSISYIGLANSFTFAVFTIVNHNLHAGKT